MHQQVELTAAGMAPGTSLRDICPKCGGGSGRERSLSITISEEGVLKWFCFRASCGYKGRRGLWGVVGEPGLKAEKPPQTFSGALERLPGPVRHWFEEEYGLDPSRLEFLGWRYAPDRDRIYIPYIGPRGQFRGAILREWKNKLEPRNIVYKQLRDEPFMGWFPQDGDDRPVLVEDALSACKLYQAGVNAISLCGTHLSANMVREILSTHTKADLALDKDAFAKAVKMAAEFRGVLNIKVWKLDKDLKYVSEDRILRAYCDGETTFP
jgi:hypothetical protein